MKKRIPSFPCRTAISFFLLPTFLFQQKESNEKDDSILSLPNGNPFFLLPTFLFSAKRKVGYS